MQIKLFYEVKCNLIKLPKGSVLHAVDLCHHLWSSVSLLKKIPLVTCLPGHGRFQSSHSGSLSVEEGGMVYLWSPDQCFTLYGAVSAESVWTWTNPPSGSRIMTAHKMLQLWASCSGSAF